MPHDRFYHPGPLKGSIVLEGDEQHHLFKVMRAHAGTQIELIDGKGMLAQATVVKIDRKTAELSITHSEFCEPTLQRVLGMSLIKQPKLELVIEKCTELGITDFHLFPAAHSERDHLSLNHQNRLHAITISASKQCGRLYLPTIHLHTEIHIPESSAYATLAGNPTQLRDTKTKSILIGPEKGWSQAEEALLIAKAKPVSLHDNILRAETAAIVAAAILS